MTKDEILAAPPHMVHRHINSLGVINHRFEPNIHYHSAWCRKMAKESPDYVVEHDPLDPSAEPKRYERYSDIADHLDSLHQQFHEHGNGRIVVFTDEEVIQHALNLAEGTHKVENGKVVPK